MNITSLPSVTTAAQGQSSADRHSPSKTLPGSGVLSGISSAPDPKQSALELVEHTLARAYEKLGLRIDKAGASYSHVEPLTAEKVADNILGFISRRLHMDLADGATPEQLQSRLDAGLSGFKKGFAEASEKLQALSMLSPEIKQDIGKIYDLVTQGIDQLQQQFISGKASMPLAPEPSAIGSVQRAAAMSGSYQSASTRSFSFELMTGEGDRVTITAAASLSYAAHYTVAGQGKNNLTASQVASANSRMDWAVEGDLNKQELNSINQLLGQINQLAGEFFNGNLDEAFNQALALGYDKQQIASFSLSLTQVEVQKVSTVYQTFNDTPLDSINLAEKLLPLGYFIKHLLDAVEQLEGFPEAKSILPDVAEKMIDAEQQSVDQQSANQPATRFRLFVEQILNSMIKV